MSEHDQAKQLRQQMKSQKRDKAKAEASDQTLPPRSRVHQSRAKHKKKKYTLSFPLIRLLLILFLALIIAAVTFPYWMP
ncbi:hypothetical protein [Halalkalibacter akibai]|uniref:Uncharacterized protein n=1 Tax=Halalkalibacter akibai (strain ATCC 43226 / DSM 21942 / CIP 109018 / JCM 9157 / 1139) TaxID=1236973 RepID=W4QUW6_HALA3|nr:hypothetical protein [Halalkalibacter akibai]GAE35891.1 hypothetical protein JCM9157_3028 [Halalkalibacter akibai JCM 9157]